VTGALVAVLLRPFWVAAVAFAVSALAMFFTWDISMIGIIGAAIYLLVGLLYVLAVRGEIENRINFSVWHLMRPQIILLVLLTAFACTSIYFGYAEEIDKNGFTFSEETTDWIVNVADEHVMDEMFPEGTLSDMERQDALDELGYYLENDVKNDMEPYDGYMPVGLAAVVFGIMTPITFLLSWIPILILSLAFIPLIRLGAVKKVAKAVEVVRLSIE
jgi:hypothetical protein